jgi:hypothetical protein
VQLEGFGQLNNPAASSGIKAATCQLVAKWLYCGSVSFIPRISGSIWAFRK